MNQNEKKPAGHGGPSSDVAGRDGKTESNSTQFCTPDQGNASISARRGLVDGIQRVLAGRTETWTNPWPGFIEDVLYAACGAVPFHEGAWRFFDTTVCCAMQYCVCPADEEGWHRWRLPSPDGIVRPDDWSAPWITRSPSGSLFWCNGRDPKRELVKSLGALLDRCFELRAQVVRVAA